ncbi:MAG: RDD family protein, partial [Ignavibacteria bacterium]|nr:RDD family protein [Ignavibacteria bacterium]
ALSLSDTEYYESLNWMKKQEYLMTLLPIYFTLYTWTSNIWAWGELFVLLLNKRKRALHDFIAETVIVRTKYIDKMRVAMNTVEKE